MSDRPQSPATFAEFGELFPTEEAAAQYFEKWRWPEGFRCPACGEGGSRLATRRVWQCRSCRRQTSLTAGTALQHTKVPLRIWVYAMWLMGRRKKGTSALQFQRETGLGNYGTALYLLHKVRETLVRPEGYRLEGTVELDTSISPERT